MEAALESSLSVEEAERMLQELAAKGHLEVSIEHGKLHYALWVREAPLCGCLSLSRRRVLSLGKGGRALKKRIS